MTHVERHNATDEQVEATARRVLEEIAAVGTGTEVQLDEYIAVCKGEKKRVLLLQSYLPFLFPAFLVTKMKLLLQFFK